MYPVLFQVGGFSVHSYGVLVAAAFLAAIWVGSLEARRKGLPGDTVNDLALPVILAGLAGGRLAYVLGWEPELLWRDPFGVLAVWRGGLALHGGLLAGLAAGVWYARGRRLSVWRLGDALAPALILGQGIGRVGCFLSGDSYGSPSALPWAVTFTDAQAMAPQGVPLHPVQLYELGLDLALLAALWGLRRRTTFDGQLFLLYMGGYGVIRLVTEVFRGDRVDLGFGLSLLQGASLAFLAAALVTYAWRLTARRV
ncbi:MAG: prolipoprotein diacylglyceryl transferase [Candidatus Rokubacteria bacterium GWC2_70_24]|nr:MAG: prolipoprotein diacylglyceryl transferase [Candidatus Rokubacteria bacterium GWA2_70_23]OGK90883.1 MAG: prolipoprotein diacylglyceryl transferase [Candidatus Rokubacteria bacterium GWC2_70_24]HAM60123.1 prolipoprotein diacylglyceryl transferase [Candidatus Rokubacteria bacterium]